MIFVQILLLYMYMCIYIFIWSLNFFASYLDMDESIHIVGKDALKKNYVKYVDKLINVKFIHVE